MIYYGMSKFTNDHQSEILVIAARGIVLFVAKSDYEYIILSYLIVLDILIYIIHD